MAVLITGGSGFIGTKLIELLSKKEEIICLSRKKPEIDIPFVQGSFDNLDDLFKMDNYKITSLIHLAAVTGGCSEEEGLSVNVLGLRRLIRYLIDQHKCRKFIITSSIAAAGCLSDDFFPQQFPIADDHICLAKDAYGLSKSMAEDITKYFNRIYPETDFINLRLGAVCPDETWYPEPVELTDSMKCPITQLTRVLASDIVNAFYKAFTTTFSPGVRIYNVAGPDVSCDVSAVEALYTIYGKEIMDRYDLSYYTKSGNEFKSLFGMDKIKKELGFEPVQTTIPLKRKKLITALR
jgi:nucleoside-diphosphate-sugar epimerase